MRIALTGSSGLIGTALRKRLEAVGHEVVPLVRGTADQPAATWHPPSGWVRPGVLDGVDAVINLGGASIGSGRWTAARRRDLRASRIETTKLLAAQIDAMPNRPLLMNASAVGYYGNRASEVLDEDAGRGTGFLADLTADWENAATDDRAADSRTAILRFGVVLSRHGGALPRMLLPFRIGLGGRLGNGRQWMSWVSLDDATGAIQHVLEGGLTGTFNVTAPNPVTNREFTRVLARTLHRPALFPVPPLALRALLGEAADELLLASQRAVPARLQASGFIFQHANVETALASALKGS